MHAHTNTHTHTHTNMHTHMHACTHTQTHTHTRTNMHTNMHTHAHTCTCTHTHYHVSLYTSQGHVLLTNLFGVGGACHLGNRISRQGHVEVLSSHDEVDPQTRASLLHPVTMETTKDIIHRNSLYTLYIYIVYYTVCTCIHGCTLYIHVCTCTNVYLYMYYMHFCIYMCKYMYMYMYMCIKYMYMYIVPV